MVVQPACPGELLGGEGPVIIIGGGVSNKSEKFLPFLASSTEVVVEAAQMRNEAGIIGAACLAVHPDGPGNANRPA